MENKKKEERLANTIAQTGCPLELSKQVASFVGGAEPESLSWENNSLILKDALNKATLRAEPLKEVQGAIIAVSYPDGQADEHFIAFTDTAPFKSIRQHQFNSVKEFNKWTN